MRVKSSILRDVEYNAVTSELLVTFTTGRRYSFKKVPILLYAKLLAAPSAGSFFSKNIKKHFKYEVLKNDRKNK